MKIYKSLDEIDEKASVCMAFGNFDGLHRGHMEILKTCLDKAKERQALPGIFTFSELTANALAGKTVVKRLMSENQKEKILSDLGFSFMVSVPFAENIRNLSKEEFTEKISSIFKLSTAICGFNYSFGKFGAGKALDFKALLESKGTEVIIVPKVCINGKTVSSTLLRQLVIENRFEEYEEFAGRKYTNCRKNS